ncbi:MAG: MMPL family transporter [Gammaproteobacteria bacterium]|nr:MMPL family transporter [Gammaproteobacteria bacterium]
MRLVRRYAPAVLAVAFALAFLAVRYTAHNISMNTDTEHMLSAELSWRKLDQEYERLFPQYDNNILIVLEAATPDQAGDAASLLYERLQAERDLFEFVYYPNALPVFRESGLLYLDGAELQDLSDNLAEVQPFLARLARDPTLRGLFEVLGDALDAADDGDEVDIEPVLTRINAALEALRDGRPYRLSWQQLMSGDGDGGSSNADGGGDGAGDDRYREFILTQPKLDYAGFFPATPAIDSIRGAYDELGIAASPGAALRLTGATMLAHEEMLSVMKGTETAILLALCLVTVIMVTGLSSLKLALVTVISLITGLAYTAAFAILTVGELNLISVAFAVLYIGLGVDFAIHYCLRYREHLIDGTDRGGALDQTSVNIGGSLFLCAVSTAIGFFAFIPTDYTGVAELGWISGFSMFISFAVTITVIPALLSLLPFTPGASPGEKSGPDAARLVERHAGKILGATACLALASAVALGGLRFDHNPLNLHARDGAALTTYRELLADNDLTPWTAIMIAADAQQAEGYRAALSRSGLVDKVVTVADFIPAGQDEKLFIIDEMGLLLGDLALAPPDPAAQTVGGRLEALRGFRDKLREADADDPVHEKLLGNLEGLLEAQEGVDSRLRGDDLAQLERMLLASLPGRLDALDTSLNADYISLETLPDQLKRLWVSAGGERRVEIYPKHDMQDNKALREFVRGIQSVSPEVTGAPVNNLEASDAVAAAFGQAFLYAFIAITLMLFILLTRKRDVFLVLVPLLTAALVTGGVAVLAGLPLNFANVIALPLLLGIGVDSGIHIIHRFRTDLPAGKNILATSSARAVIVSSLTTMGGVGNLALSPHAGTASMGMLLTLGIGVTLACMLLVLPALLAVIGRPRRE